VSDCYFRGQVSVNKKIRVGVIGLGKMGLLHASLLNTFPNVELAALCEKSPLVKKLGEKIFLNQSIVDNVKNLSRSDLDAVFVTTPIPSHFAISNQILKDEIANHLFVEKTLSSNYGDSQALFKLAEASTGINMVGYMKRFNVVFKKAKELLESDAVGEISSFDAFAFSSDFVSSEKGAAVSTNRGGVLRDLGGHIIDLAIWLFGNMTVESAILQQSSSNSEDAAKFKIKTISGLKGSFNVSWCEMGYRMPEFGLSILGSKGKMTVTNDKLELELNNQETNIWYRQNLHDNVPFLLGDPEYFYEDKHFIQAIVDDSAAEPTFYSASLVDNVLDQVKKLGST
jgi:predicted dehydrogenase